MFRVLLFIVRKNEYTLHDYAASACITFGTRHSLITW